MTKAGGGEREGVEDATLDFEDGGRGHKPRSARSLQKPKKASKCILPESLQEHSPAPHLGVGTSDPRTVRSDVGVALSH